MTSRDVVNRVCKVIGSKRVGHAGTLDPLATGILVMGIGPATRLIRYVQAMPKTYLGDFRLGFESETEDRLGEVTEIKDAPIIRREQFENVLSKFIGTIEQTPPVHSALRLNGKRAYELARQGEKVKLEPRPIEIHAIHLVDWAYPDFRLRIDCGSGTYVRSLGRDIARSLGTGAIMTELERTAIGSFDVSNAIAISEVTPQSVNKHLLSAREAIGTLPVVTVDDVMVRSFLDGEFYRLEWAAGQSVELNSACQEIVAVDHHDRLIAVLERFDASNFKPKINFAHFWHKP